MSGDEPRPSSRPATPESPYTSTHNLDHATSTIDDLTLALANFSRVPSPEPPSLLTCCCGENDCENMASWLNMKSRLESRLILSAEVGQALLQRHETYVRRQGKRRQRSEPLEYDDAQAIQENLERRIHELQRERDALEKRLTQALVNNEVTEVSSNTILQELHEAKTTVTRLTAHHAKSIGWEARMSAALKERDDMQQERDFESHRARLAESRFAALKDKTSRLQADVRRLHDDLQDKRMHRLESSESILQDARSQLQVLQRSLSPSVASEQTELTKVLESLMEDNEVLKRDSAELQHFLAESREEILALQEEVEEHRANAPRSSAGTPRTPTYQHHFHSGSMTSSILREHMSGRSSSTERNNRRPYDLLTPESHIRPLSPADSDSRWTSFSHPQPAHTSTPYNINVVDPDDDDATSEFERPRSHKPLLLLSRSRGIQTDPLPIERDRNPMFSSSPLDPRSDSSSYSESTSNMAQLIERVALLLNRISQADALTLTNRLKRQHLHGADVGHLSRTTVNNIITEASNLRLHFRALLEDDKMVTTCNRRDLRTLFKLFRDMFTELGQMRVTLNEVVLDPSVAPKVREWAMDPAKAEAEAAKARNTGGGDNVAGWMAPISKLFGATGARPEAVASGERGAAALTRSLSGKGPTRPPRFVPKLSPALSASATTVNVEFSGSGVGRAVTSTASPHPSRPGLSAQQSSTTGQSVMGIFAGAPRSSTPDPWVVLPKEPRRVQSTILNIASPPTPRRTHTMSAQRMSRNVDAIVDVENSALSRVDQDSEEPDYLGPLREHTLKRRGLSDSSIHSTFMSQAEPNESVGSPSRAPDSRWPSRGSVLQALSRKVQNFRLGPPVVASGSSSDNDGVSPGGSSVAASEGKEQSSGQSHQTFGNFIAIPGLSHWAGNEPSYIGSELFGSSPPTLRDEPSLMERRREDFY